jgi:hypothetical protein
MWSSAFWIRYLSKRFWASQEVHNGGTRSQSWKHLISLSSNPSMKHVTQSINTSLQNRKLNQAGEKRIGPHPPPSLNKRPISTNKATINPQLCCSFEKLSKHPQRQPAEVIIIWLVSQYLLHFQRASSHMFYVSDFIATIEIRKQLKWTTLDEIFITLSHQQNLEPHKV